jgi:hypothetical protein
VVVAVERVEDHGLVASMTEVAGSVEMEVVVELGYLRSPPIKSQLKLVLKLYTYQSYL